MAQTKFEGNVVNTVGDLPSVGEKAPEFALTGVELNEVKLSDYEGQNLVLNIFPSLDTDVCAASVRKFNKAAGELDNTTVLSVSADLPFAMDRFCVNNGLDNVVSGSTFRSSFPEDYGVKLLDGPLAGLNTRSVVVIDPEGVVQYVQLVPEITTEPDYDAALEAVKAL
ncbi:MAG: thiol peroxidase [Lawsonella sp.]|nr:thiol peroxidase [Mycobacteriales bacterium]